MKRGARSTSCYGLPTQSIYFIKFYYPSILFVISLFWSQQEINGQSSKGLTVNISLSEAQHLGGCDTLNARKIKVTLKNNSIHTNSFWMMTCSTYENFSTNDSNIMFCKHICFSNFDRRVHLKSGKDTSFYFQILPANSNYNKELKIGFIYVGAEEIGFSELISTIKKRGRNNKILWSNTLVN